MIRFGPCSLASCCCALSKFSLPVTMICDSAVCCFDLQLLLSLFFGDSLLLGNLLGPRIFLEQLLRRHLQRRIPLQTLIQRLVVNGFGMELLLDPLFQAHLANSLDIARTRAVRQAIHRVKNRFIFGELR